MSARPDVRRLSAEELDVLISRALDGDLPPEDQQLLDEILASDPRAAARRGELAGVVAALGALPAPGAPLGMAARVAATATERSTGLAGLWQRFGIFPPPAAVRGAAAVFAIVVIGISVMRSQSERAKRYEQMEATAVARSADQSEGVVSVFFEEKKKDVPAGAPADAVAGSGPAVAAASGQKPAELRPGANEPVREARAKPRAAERGQVAGLVASQPPAGERPALGGASKDEKLAAAEADTATRRIDSLEKRQAAPSGVASLRDEAVARKANVGGEPSAQSFVVQAAAPAPPAAPAALAPPRLTWLVSVVGAPGWMLKKAPDAVPARPYATRCVVTIDASGRVNAVRPAGAPIPKEIDDLVRGLVFVPVAAGGKAPASGEIEIEIRAR